MNQSIFYVDIENLQDFAKQGLCTALKDWPDEIPQPIAINLYVRADQVGLWKIWANHRFPQIEIEVKGVQHYTTGSKNSADIALTLDAITDFLKGRAQYIAIMSDDSDYAALFVAIKLETDSTENQKVPFKWFMTDRSDTRSAILTDFFPVEYIQTVRCNSPAPVSKESSFKPQTPPPGLPSSSPTIKKPAPENNLSDAEAIAKAIIHNIPLGPFKSLDCKRIISLNFPEHYLAKANISTFGTRFVSEIWPVLEKYGVQLPNPNKRPRKYEMTQEAKGKTEDSLPF